MYDSVTSWTVAHQSPLSVVFSRQDYWRGLLFPISGDLSNPDMGSVSLKSLELQVDSLPTESSRKPF